MPAGVLLNLGTANGVLEVGVLTDMIALRIAAVGFERETPASASTFLREVVDKIEQAAGKVPQRLSFMLPVSRVAGRPQFSQRADLRNNYRRRRSH